MSAGGNAAADGEPAASDRQENSRDSAAPAGAATARETARAWRERNAEQIREYKSDWRDRDADHIAAYRKAYRAEHLDEIRAKGREQERARHARQRAEQERREQKRAQAREWYAANRDRHLEAQRQYRIAQRAKDPVAYRESKRERNKRWRDGHRDEQNAKLRDKHHANPEVKRAAAERYYANNAEKVKAKRRQRYAVNKEKELARQRQWRTREKRRIDAGLPPRRLHSVSAPEKRMHQEEATKFFARRYSTDQIVALEKSLHTEAELIAKFNRDSLRVRAKAHQDGDPGMHDRLGRSETRKSALEQERAVRRAAKAAENARLDAIARQINDRLRTQPRRARSGDFDPSAPHAGPGSSRGGMGL